MSPRTTRIVGFVAFAAFVVFIAVLPEFISDFSARLLVRRHLPDRTARPQHPHGLHRADLARARRLHGDRRVHDGDPHGRQRAVRPEASDLRRHEGRLDAPYRRSRRRPRRARVRDPGAAALRPLSRAGDVRNRSGDAVDRQALRGVHGGRLRHSALRRSGAHRLHLQRRDPRPVVLPERLDLLPRLVDRARGVRRCVAHPARTDRPRVPRRA